MCRTIEIPITQNKIVLIDEKSYPLIQTYKWYAFSFRNGKYWYAISKAPRIRMHRLIIGANKGQFVDHINGNGLDNRLENLRIVTNQQNLMNQRKTNKPTYSQYKGVSFLKDRSKWVAQIKFNGKVLVLGHFDNEDKAARAYDLKAKKLFGEYARLNFSKGFLNEQFR